MIQLGASIRIEGCDDNLQAGAACELLSNRDKQAEVAAPAQVSEGTKEVEEVEQAKEVEPEKTPTPGFTRESLEKIADADGIEGLRRVAPEGVKGRSIRQLIDEILAAQEVDQM